MRTRLLLVIIAAVGAVGAFVGISGAFAGSAPRSGVTVKPKKGRPGTKFVVRFVAPDAAGRHGVISTDYVVEASAVSARRGCVSQIVVRVERAAANTSASAKLAPAAGGASGSTPRAASGRWCK